MTVSEADLLAAWVRWGDRGLSTRAIAARLGLGEEALPALEARLRALQIEGEIVQVPGRGWCRPEGSGYLVGILRVARRRFGFVVPVRRDPSGDVFVDPEGQGPAFDGDRVVVRLEASARPGPRRGVVVRVVRRRRSAVRGSFVPAGEHGAFVVPDERHGAQDIWIPPEETAGARDGQRVLVRLHDGPGWGIHPRGRVVHVLGRAGTLGEDLERIRAEFDLPGPFPGEVLREAAAAAARPIDPAGRLDLRGERVFTIDPADAQDFDDAVSLAREPDGTWVLGVHIADVSAYAPPGSAVDREARERAGSVYLPGATIHMIPEPISCGAASLAPGRDRLTKTVRIRIAPDGERLGWRIAPSIVRSQRRFTYEEVQGILDLALRGMDVPAPARPFVPALLSMHRLMEILHRRRRERGALAMEIPKTRLVLDDAGRVVGIEREERLDAHRIIEEFMLLANEVAALEAGARGLPIPTRIHPDPDPKALREFFFFLGQIGLAPPRRGTGARDLQAILDRVQGEPYARSVNVALLRSLARAAYAPKPGRHFALATSAYCHFTSPIRRLPDLVIHQVLDEHFAGRLHPGGGIRAWRAALPEIARRATDAEERAEEAEEAMTRLLLARYLAPRIGQEMDAIVLAVGPGGLVVQVEDTLIEGRIHIATLSGDVYAFDSDAVRIVGRRRRRSFRPGDRIPVRLAAVDPDAPEFDFEWIGP